ncbi:MAG: IS5 family transposase [Emticicia sp.]|nr:IS5 family transposase [Emticicia sp.]
MGQRYSTLTKLSKTKFRRYIGVTRDIFNIMVVIVTSHEKKRKKKDGRNANLTIEDQILMTLTYYREYRTFFHLGTDYGLHESNVQRTVEKIENILLKSGYFNLPGKKVLLSNEQITTILTDATESPAFRPKKKIKNGKKIKRSSKQRRKYSGKKKRHTHKSQVIVNADTLEIICVSFANGSCHDFKLYKNSKIRINPSIKQKTDSGYQGLEKLHQNSDLPQKKTKKHKLDKEQKKKNRKLSSERVENEHVIGKLKIFKILENRYRSHSGFGKIFTLISGIYNANLAA